MVKPIKKWVIRDKAFCSELYTEKSDKYIEYFGDFKFISWNKYKAYIIFKDKKTHAEMLDAWPDAQSIKHAVGGHAKNIANIPKAKHWQCTNTPPSKLGGVFKDSAIKTLADFENELPQESEEEAREKAWVEENKRRRAEFYNQ